MSLIAYSEFENRVRKNVFPDVDNDGTESHLEPSNLRFPHRTYIQNALIQAQTYVECLRENNVETYTLTDATVNCGVAIFDLPDHARLGAVYAYKPAKGCTRQHYTQRSVNKVMCFVDQFASCKCSDENDICNAVRSGDAVCDNLALCDDWDADDGEDDRPWLCEEKIFAVGRGGKLYVAPRIPCGYRLAVHWEGIKYRYADDDLITDDPDLLDLVSTYVQAERARTFDRDMPLWTELIGKGPGRGGRGASAWHEKLAAMGHRCREERRIRTRACSEMWDDSAIASENIGAQLDPVPGREDGEVVFERCDGCNEGQVLIDGECVDCLTPIVSISVDDSTLAAGQVVTVTWNSSNVLDLESSRVTLEHDGQTIVLTKNEGGSMAFTPTANTTYTIRAATVCGEDVTASVSVTVGEDLDDCPCPEGLTDCLAIRGFDETTFTQLGLLESMTQDSLIDVDLPASDLSGLTFSPVTGTLFGIKNVPSGDSQILEYDLDGTVLRTITTTNFTDTEGITWMCGHKFAISEENPVNRITIVTIEDDDTTLDRADFTARSFSTGVASDNLGIEGCGYDPVRGCLYFTTEKAHTGVWNVWKMNVVTGAIEVVFDVLDEVADELTDISDLYYDRNTEHLFILSHESSLVLEVTLAGVIVNQLAISGITQAEGIAFTPNLSEMWIVGEPQQFARYSSEVIECSTGNTSTADAWDGTLESTDDCLWGFALGTKSYRGQNVSAFVLLDHCDDDGTLVYRLQVVLNTADGGEVLWNGTSRNSPVGTYTREDGVDCGTTTLVLTGCNPDACESLDITFDPPAESIVSYPTNVVIACEDETAIIHYTTDGSEPTNASPIYTGLISLGADDILQARAYTAECEGEVFATNYGNADEIFSYFHFEYLCDAVDKAGVFGEFEANGENDYHWHLQYGINTSFDISTIELYEVNAAGVWVTGQAWATANPVYPDELDGDPFSIYPLVIIQGSSQLNTDYADAFGSFPSADYNWHMYGQPFVPLVGYFKLKITGTFGGFERTIYKVIPHDCYYCDEEYYVDCEGDIETPNPQSNNLVNIDFLTEGSTEKSGAAAVGLAGDYWNTFNFNPGGAASELDLKWANGTDTGFTCVEGNETNEALSIFSESDTTGHADSMMQNNGVIPATNYVKRLVFNNIPRGLYNVYVFGHGSADSEILSCKVVTPAQETAVKSTAVGTGWDGPFANGENYVKFANISFLTVEETDLAIELLTGASNFISGIQLEKIQ